MSDDWFAVTRDGQKVPLCCHVAFRGAGRPCARRAKVVVAGVGPLCDPHARAEEARDRKAGEPYEAVPLVVPEESEKP